MSFTERMKRDEAAEIQRLIKHQGQKLLHRSAVVGGVEDKAIDRLHEDLLAQELAEAIEREAETDWEGAR